MLRNPQLTWAALAAFSRSMARMMEAGVEVRKSLQTSSKQSADRRLTGAIEKVTQSVAGGKTLAEAFRKEGDSFRRCFEISSMLGNKQVLCRKCLRRCRSIMNLASSR